MIDPVLGSLALCLALVVLIENLQKSLISTDFLLIKLFEMDSKMMSSIDSI